MANRVPSAADDAARLKRLMRAAIARAERAAAVPVGRTDKAREFNRARELSKLAGLRTALVPMLAQANQIVDRQVAEATQRGVDRADKLARDAGLIREDSPIIGGLTGAETARAGVLSRSKQVELTNAVGSISTPNGVVGRAVRQSNALGLNQAKLKRILAGGALDGAPLQTVKAVRELYRNIGDGRIVEVVNKHGVVMTFPADHYANLVYQTSMAEAANVAEVERLVARASYYVRIIGSNSDNFCTAYVGRVYYIGPGNDPLGRYPRLDTLPRGGAPFHPFCSKRYVPFNPATATPQQLKDALPTPESMSLAGIDEIEAQRRFVAQQPKPVATPPTAPASQPSQPRGVPMRTPAEVRAAVELIDRSTIVAPAIRTIVDVGLTDVARLRYSLPRAVRVVQPKDRLAFERPASIDLREPSEVIVDPRWPHWSDAGAHARRAYDRGLASTPLPAMPIITAIGSSIFARRVGIERFRELATLPILRFVTIDELAAIDAAVSDDAATSPAMFLSEVFAMLVAGLPVPALVMAAFRRLLTT